VATGLTRTLNLLGDHAEALDMSGFGESSQRSITSVTLPGDFSIRPWNTVWYAFAAALCAAVSFALLLGGSTVRGVVGILGTLVWIVLAILRAASRLRIDHQGVSISGYRGTRLAVKDLVQVSVFKSSRFGWDVAVATHDQRTIRLASGVSRERADEVANTLLAANRSAISHHGDSLLIAWVPRMQTG
jgi:hypothetical protein